MIMSKKHSLQSEIKYELIRDEYIMVDLGYGINDH